MINKLIFLKDLLKKGWSIGIYCGVSPFDVDCYNINPIITAKDVSDVTARSVADPFIIEKDKNYYLFFEVENLESGKGEIGLAFSNDAINWSYQKIVLSERFHLSYPLVFIYKGNYYMIPESGKAFAVRLYKAEKFPYQWRHVSNLLEGKSFLDSTLFYYSGYWWLFTTSDSFNLNLYYSDSLLEGNWLKHPCSPVYTGEFARPAGRVLVHGNKIYRFAQNPYPEYGSSIIAYEIYGLNTTSYFEKEVLKIFLGPSGKGWNGKRMHHVDFLFKDNKWLVVADGYSEDFSFRPEALFASIKRMNKKNKKKTLV